MINDRSVVNPEPPAPLKRETMIYDQVSALKLQIKAKSDTIMFARGDGLLLERAVALKPEFPLKATTSLGPNRKREKSH